MREREAERIGFEHGMEEIKLERAPVLVEARAVAIL